MGKSFDNFTPVGLAIVSPRIEMIKATIEDGLPVVKLQTRVNGHVRQETSTGDLLFRLTGILKYLSVGRTIRKGTVIMTGTPCRVAAFLQPPAWLQKERRCGRSRDRREGLDTIRIIMAM